MRWVICSINSFDFHNWLNIVEAGSCSYFNYDKITTLNIISQDFNKICGKRSKPPGIDYEVMMNDELFLRNGWPAKGVYAVFPAGSIADIVTIANLQHATSRISIWAESEFRLCWMKFCSSDNYYTTVPRRHFQLTFWHKARFGTEEK